MWSALENAALRESLPKPLATGDSVHGILVSGQFDRGRYNLHHLGRRQSKPYLLKQYYSIDANAFLRWQNEARFINTEPAHGFVWPTEEWRGGVISPLPAGLPLDEWMDRKPRSMETRLAAAARLARRIARLHRSGIVHRNLSPSAVWIGNDSLDVTDFGSARCPHLDDLWTDSAYACSDATFASPELFRHNECGPEHDVYGFGVLLHLLATGWKPFGPIRKLLASLIPGAPLPFSLSASTDLPGRVRELITACLTTNPFDRPTMVEAAAALEPYGPGGHTLEKRIPLPPGSKEKRNRVMVFVTSNSRAVPLFDASLRLAASTPAIFMFVSMVPGNLPSGHMERFKGALFRRLGQGLLRCREAGMQWSLRLLDSPDPNITARLFVEQYAPDTIIVGESLAKGRLRHAFHDNLPATDIHVSRVQ